MLDTDRLEIEEQKRVIAGSEDRDKSQNGRLEKIRSCLVAAEGRIARMDKRMIQLETACGSADLQRDAMFALVVVYRRKYPDYMPSTLSEFPAE